MYIWSNPTELKQYEGALGDIYIEHSEYYRRVFEKRPSTFKNLSFSFGEYLGIGEKINDRLVTREVFLEYVEEITKKTPEIPFEIVRSDILQDPVSGHSIHLFPDNDAVQQMTLLNEKLFSGEFGEGMYHERGIYVASAQLSWIKSIEEANLILNDINNLSMKIMGRIDTLRISDVIKRDNENPKVEVIKSFRLSGLL